MRRNLPTLLVIACLGLAGCGGDAAPEGPKPLDARAVATMPFEAPADGKLTPELLDRFTSVIQAQREQLE